MDQPTALDLCIPPQRNPDRDCFDYRPKAVEAWLKNLPIANLGETTRALYEALRELNQLRIKPAARLACLEALGERIDYVRDGLRKHYPPREFPLPPKSRAVAELVLTLLREMATGYNVIIQAALGGERIDRMSLALSVYRALRYLGDYLVEVYGLYEPPPEGLWKTAHGLYLTAESRRLQALAVVDRRLEERRRGSVADAYKQILLLAAAGPYRMRINEAADVYRLLERWTPLCRLGGDGVDAAFCVRLQSDLPPLPAAKAGQPGADVRALVTDGLQAVGDGETQPPWWRLWRRPPPASDPELVRRIVVSLGVTPNRRYSRLPVESRNRVQVMIGLSHICKVLADEQGLEGSATSREARFLSREVRRADREADDVWDLVFPAEALAEAEEPPQAEAGAPARPAAEPHAWQLLNVSAGGYCLLSDPTQSARAQVGELIALREVSDRQPGHWQAGVIRWMKHVPAHGLQLGVQVLAPSPMPVTLRPHLDEGGLGASSRALMLPEVMAVEQPATLVAPCLAGYAIDRVVNLNGLGSDSDVVLTHRLECSGAFAQFGFRSAGGAGPERAALESVFSSI